MGTREILEQLKRETERIFTECEDFLEIAEESLQCILKEQKGGENR